MRRLDIVLGVFDDMAAMCVWISYWYSVREAPQTVCVCCYKFDLFKKQAVRDRNF